jgi:hypothetical protein
MVPGVPELLLIGFDTGVIDAVMLAGAAENPAGAEDVMAAAILDIEKFTTT